MGRVAALAPLVVPGIAAAAMAWQHARFLEARRERARDRQARLRAGEAFHGGFFWSVLPAPT